MASDRVEVHDLFSNHNNNKSNNGDLEPTSDSGGMGGTVEYRLLMAYASRRKPKPDSNGVNSDPHLPPTPTKTDEEMNDGEEGGKKKKRKGKKKKGWRRLSSIFSCVKPRVEDEDHHPPKPMSHEPVMLRTGFSLVPHDSDSGEADELEEVASRLTEIADHVPFSPPEIEPDSELDDVEKVVGLILREAGDRLNEQELVNANVAMELFWNYGFFEKLLKTLLRKMGLTSAEPDSLGPQASPKTQIAVACEVTSRLSAVETLPMSRMLDHGARFLQEHYSTWAQQQGGYEKAFHSDEEEGDDEVQ
ncbi:uncharacterized protein V6R79_005458 [Siganus canaliculatus]